MLDGTTRISLPPILKYVVSKTLIALFGRLDSSPALFGDGSHKLIYNLVKRVNKDSTLTSIKCLQPHLPKITKEVHRLRCMFVRPQLSYNSPAYPKWTYIKHRQRRYDYHSFHPDSKKKSWLYLPQEAFIQQHTDSIHLKKFAYKKKHFNFFFFNYYSRLINWILQYIFHKPITPRFMQRFAIRRESNPHHKYSRALQIVKIVDDYQHTCNVYSDCNQNDGNIAVVYPSNVIGDERSCNYSILYTIAHFLHMLKVRNNANPMSLSTLRCLWQSSYEFKMRLHSSPVVQHQGTLQIRLPNSNNHHNSNNQKNSRYHNIQKPLYSSPISSLSSTNVSKLLLGNLG